MRQAESNKKKGEVGSRRQKSSGLSLRARLILLVFASVVPLLALNLGRQYFEYHEEVRSTGERTLELARSMALLVEQELQARIAVLQVLARSTALRNGDFVGFRDEADAAIAEQLPGSSILVLNESGRHLMNTLLPPGAPLPIRRSLEAMQRMFASGQPVVSDLYQGIVGPRPVIGIDVPVKRDDGSIAYDLSLNPRLEDFAAIIRRQRISESWVVSVFDRQGVNVARTPNPTRFVGQQTAPALLNRLLVDHEGIFENTTRDGIPIFAAFSHSTRFGWAVAIGVPRSELTAPALHAAIRTLLVGVLLLLISVVLAVFIAQQIIRPIGTLRGLAGTTDTDTDAVLHAPSTGLPEADEVVQALRTAVENRRRSEHDEKLARAALIESEDKLRQSQKMESVGQLTGGLAHDFNNLLLVVLGNLDLLLDSGKLDSEAQLIVRETLNAAEHGADLTRSLLAFARRQPLDPQRVIINDLVGGITKMLAGTLGERVKVSLNLAPDVWPVIADRAQLEAALTNLATNARDAMPKGGRLTIVTANRQLDEDYCAQYSDVTSGDYAMIEVSDTGTGIPSSVLTNIFDPFFTTKAFGSGTGLGLSMVYGFVKQSGGHISVYSELDLGTTFRVFLPRTLQVLENSETPVVETIPCSVGGETILVVEDNIALRRLVVLQVTSLGYRVKEAENVAAALNILETGEQIDLLFTDVVMAGKLDGYDLARMVKERWPSTKIVMTSGFPNTSLDDAAVVIAHFSLLTKPYRKDALAQAIRAAIDGTADA